MIRQLYFYLFLSAYLFVPQYGMTQLKAPDFRFIPIEKGITQRAVTGIIQDDAGFIWIGTNSAGLYQYNGIEFKSYKQQLDDPSSINSSLIYALHKDSDGKLWVGTEAGLNLYLDDTDNFVEISITDNTATQISVPVHAVTEGNKGELFIGTAEHGLFLMDIDSKEISEVSFSKNFPSRDLVIHDLLWDSGQLLIASNKGLYHYNPITGQIHAGLNEDTYTLPTQDGVQVFLKDGQGSIWIGTFTHGVVKLAREGNKYSIKHLPLSDKKILSLAEGPDGSILCGTENDGLFVLNKEGVEIAHYKYDKFNSHSIKSNSIWSVFSDNEERIWIGYYNQGIAVWDPNYDKFQDLESRPNMKNSLQSASVTGIIQDSSGKLWIGMDGGGVDIYDPKNQTFQHLIDPENGHYSGLNSPDVQSIFKDSKENIWVGTWSDGIYLLPKGKQVFRHFNTANTAGILLSNSITAFTETLDGTIWIATYYGGLHSYNPYSDSFSNYNHAPYNEALTGEIHIRTVLADKDDNLWLATTKGVYKVCRKAKGKVSIEPYNRKMRNSSGEDINNDIILSLYEDSREDIWIGTVGSGLFQYSPKMDSFRRFDVNDGLEQENITGIIEDLNGDIWISGDKGISKLLLDQRRFLNFSISDGLLANDFNYNAVYGDSSGTLYFGSYEGINYVSAEEIILNPQEPRLYLSGLKLFNQEVSPGAAASPLQKVLAQTSHLTLEHNQSVITLEYAGINHTRAENNEYAYYLEGFESDWNYVGTNRSATYMNLSPGDYVFHLKAANNDGLWTQDPISLGITILPPWWRTYWAYLGYTALLMILGYNLYSYTNQRLREKRLIKFERDKNRQIEILNEKKLQFFTNISHEFRTPLTLILNPLQDILDNRRYPLFDRELRDKHRIIHKNANRLMRLINELMDFRKLDLNKMSVKASRIELCSFIQEISEYFEEEASEKNILFSTDFQCDSADLWADPGMLEKVVFNLLSNAFKATPENGVISLGIAPCNAAVDLPLYGPEPVEAIEIYVEDSGMGISESEIQHIFERFYHSDNMNRQYYGASGTGIGLEVVQNFIALHKGKIEVNSKAGMGTTFRVYLPLYDTHFSERELIPIDTPDVLGAEISTSENSDKLVVPNSFTGQDKKTVLIVEDNIGLRNYLSGELEEHYNILEAGNGVKAFKLAVSRSPDVIITDVIMPGMDGFELCSQLRQDIKTSHIPILMLTAKVMSDDRVRGIDSGADAYLSKPFEMKVLRAYLNRLLGIRQRILEKYFQDTNNFTLPEKTTSLDRSFVTKVLNHINKNLDDPELNVEVLAEEMYLSRSQLYRKIKALTGMTVNEFIRKVRLEKARQMLEQGSESISEVGFMVGFSSSSYFTKCFKSHFGMLPTEVKSS